MYLSGPQIKEFVEALSKAFNPGRFDQLLLGRLDKTRANMSLKDDYIGILYDVVEISNRESWNLDLLSAARASNPGSPFLIAFEESLGFGATPQSEKAAFERIVNERSNFIDIMGFREKLGSLETWVCAFEIPQSGGTGILIGADVVLTNYHVVEPIINRQVSPSDVKCRFDHKAIPGGDVINKGNAVGLAANWDIGHAKYSAADTQASNDNWGQEELDYALVRLDQAVGSAPIGTNAEANAPKRGWLAVDQDPPSLAADDVVFVLQHPQDLSAPIIRLQPMQLSTGKVMNFVGGGLRVRHDARTLPGSSGSPVLNADLEFVALHHAGEPNNRLDYKGAYNQAIPLAEIVQHVVAGGQGESIGI